jgi:hypothetical protein
MSKHNHILSTHLIPSHTFGVSLSQESLHSHGVSMTDFYRYASMSTTIRNPLSQTIIASVTGGIASSRANPKTADAPEQFPHALIVYNYAEDEGQEDYEEDLDYEIEHHPQCPHKMVKETLFMTDKGEDISKAVEPTYKQYDCPVQRCLDAANLDDLSDENGNALDWRTLEPGRYSIEAWSTYSPSTTSSYEDWEGGLRLK